MQDAVGRYHTLIGVCLLALSVTFCSGDDKSAAMTSREAAWQNVLEHQEFRLDDYSPRDLMRSLLSSSGNCEISILCDMNHPFGMKLIVLHGGKEVITLWAQPSTVFHIEKDVLYFVQYSPSSSGCTVLAYDVTTGACLWKRELRTLGTFAHFAYSNQVVMSGSSYRPDMDVPGESSILIYGHESYGDYIDVIDRRTGDVLAEKVYRKGFR